MATTRTCRRCNGSKVYILASGAPGPCFNCWGQGVVTVYTSAEKSQMVRESQQEDAAREVVTQRAGQIAPPAGVTAYDFPTIVRAGFNSLRDHEPERLAKLYASLDAGRVDDVVRALYEYRVAVAS